MGTVGYFVADVVLAVTYFFVGRHLIRKRTPYREEDPRYKKKLLVTRGFRTYTRARFKVRYILSLECKRVNNVEFNRARMLDESEQAALAITYDRNVFQPYLKSHSILFSIECGAIKSRGQNFLVVHNPLCQVVSEAGRDMLSKIAEKEAHPFLSRIPPVTMNGCEVTLMDVERDLFNAEIIEENYSMLTDDHKQAILANNHYRACEEMIAVAVLKRRLDLLDMHEQKYESEGVVVETIKAARGVKIRWRFTDKAVPGYELVGFRKTGGFFLDQWDDTNNGVLVIHSSRNGEVVEFLKEGEAHFYTLFLRGGVGADGRQKKYSPLRFQITVAGTEELRATNAILERFEAISKDERGSIGKLLEELDIVMLYDAAFDNFLRSVAEMYKNRVDLSEDEKKEKIEYASEVVRHKREEYMP